MVQLPKSGNKNDLPISQMFCLSKILESLVISQLCAFIKVNNVL